MNAKVDAYIGRSRKWPKEMAALRPLLLRCGLAEDIKWGKPCFSHEGSNIAVMQEMKEFLALMFFKGALLDNTRGVLRSQGPNSRSAMRMEFRSVDEVTKLGPAVKACVKQAIEVERAGLTVGPAPALVFVDELQRRLERDRKFRTAFEALTPGRQREYNLYFSAAKQAQTREARIAKYSAKILAGQGLRD